MQVQKEVRQHHNDAVTSIHRHRVPKDALPDLRIPNDFSERRHLFFLNPFESGNVASE